MQTIKRQHHLLIIILSLLTACMKPSLPVSIGTREAPTSEDPITRAHRFGLHKKFSGSKVTHINSGYCIQYTLSVFYRSPGMEFTRWANYRDVDPNPLAEDLKHEAIKFIYTDWRIPVDSNLHQMDFKLRYADTTVVRTYDF